MRFARASILILVVAAVGLAACEGLGSGLTGTIGGGGGGGSNTNPLVATVRITNFAFVSNAVSIRPGGSVTWTWDTPDTTSHNVTFVANSTWNSGTRRTGPHVVQFPQAGTFSYVCTLHNGMNGVVTVN